MEDKKCVVAWIGLIVFMATMIIVVMGSWKAVVIAEANTIRVGQNISENLSTHGFAILNATVNSPMVVVNLDSLDSLMAKANEMNVTTVYRIGQISFMILGSDGIGFSYTFIEPTVTWAFPF